MGCRFLVSHLIIRYHYKKNVKALQSALFVQVVQYFVHIVQVRNPLVPIALFQPCYIC